MWSTDSSTDLRAVSATISGVSTPADFDLANTPGAPANIIVTGSSSPQSTQVASAETNNVGLGILSQTFSVKQSIGWTKKLDGRFAANTSEQFAPRVIHKIYRCHKILIIWRPYSSSLDSSL